jgi:nitroreductase
MTIVDDIIAIRTPKPRFDVLASMKKRFSPRVFSSEPISKDTMNIIMEAARVAPSARNHQPWSFYVAYKGTEGYTKIASCLPERNTWAATAPVFILACYDPTEKIDGKNKWALYDIGQSVISLILQAQELGIYARQIGTFDIDKAKKVIEVPDPYLPFITIAMGKMGTEEDYEKADPEIIKKDLTETTRKEKIFEELK